MKIGSRLLIHFRESGLWGRKRERWEEGAEIGRRWKRGNGAKSVDKSRYGGEEDKAKRKEERKIEMGRWSGNQS